MMHDAALTERTLPMTEADLLDAVTKAATFLGWRWMHIRRSDGVTMGHSGFPDLVMARRGRALFLELKSVRGSVTPDQSAWLEALQTPPSKLDRIVGVSSPVEAMIVRPEMLDDVIELLR